MTEDRLRTNIRELMMFVKRSPSALVQLLVAAATKDTFARIIDCPTYPVPVRTSDLDAAVRRLRGLFATSAHLSQELARLYAAARPLEHRKQLGQFFTPHDAAEWSIMIDTPTRADVVVDAGAGTGVFADVLIGRRVKVRSYVGMENDPILALCAAHVLDVRSAPRSFKIWYTNFLTTGRPAFTLRGLRHPTFVISNPPFVRFHNLRGRGRLLRFLELATGIKLSPLSGTGNYFLCRAVDLVGVKEGAEPTTPSPRLMFFLPREAAGAAHARRLRRDLEQKYGWRSREYAVPVQNVSSKGQQGAAALLFAFERRISRAQVSSLPREQRPLSAILQIRRGIATGCNEFFVLTDAGARLQGIPSKYLCPILPTRIALKTEEFSANDWEALRVSGKPCWLLRLPAIDIYALEGQVQEYLNAGIRRGLHETPTAQRLRKWFALPVPSAAPDVFITYMFRGSPRFILNTAGVFNLTNMLGGRFRPMALDARISRDVVAELTCLARSWFEGGNVGREYRDGLRKIEPRELQELPLSDLIIAMLPDSPAKHEDVNRTLFD